MGLDVSAPCSAIMIAVASCPPIQMGRMTPRSGCGTAGFRSTTGSPRVSTAMLVSSTWIMGTTSRVVAPVYLRQML